MIKMMNSWKHSAVPLPLLIKGWVMLAADQTRYAQERFPAHSEGPQDYCRTEEINNPSGEFLDNPGVSS